MKKFILKTGIFFFLIIIADFSIGKAFAYLTTHARGGFTYRDNYICDSLRTDVLLSGSSRCVRHYDPIIISDSLGVSCYNAGQMGNGIILNYGRLLMINERQRPKLVIYDLHPGFDMLKGEDNHRYLTWLRGHYDRAGIADIFCSVDETEKYKMTSQLYRYNSRFFELVSDYIQPLLNTRPDGFSPLKGKLDRMKIKEKVANPTSYAYDSLKLEYISKFIDEVGADKIIFVVSPSWYGMDTIQFQPVKNICQKKGIPFLDFSNVHGFVHNDSLFKDGNHMNALGASKFTKDLVKVLRNYGLSDMK